MKEYHKKNQAAFSAISNRKLFSGALRRKLLWNFSILSWGFFLGMVISTLLKSNI
ncbi:MAG: hypothetical protein J6S58_07710 [Lentisphaeria bacterium]|nr:hypothetical protein [Lentisphaeria bacterium]